MSDIQPITPDNKRKLVGLINKMAQHVQDGLTPTDALVKAAEADEYPQEFLMRAAEAYNGAAHLSHFKRASTDQRGDSFPLCDGAAAIKQLFAGQKMAAKVAPVSADIFAKEASSHFTSLPEEPVVKQASTDSLPTISEIIKAAHSLAASERLTMERYRSLHDTACDDLARSIIKFRQKTASVGENRRLEWAREAIEKFGADCSAILTSALGLSADRIKQASATKVGFFSLGNEDLEGLFGIVRDYEQAGLLHEKYAKAEAEHYMQELERKFYLDQALGIKRATGVITSLAANMGDIGEMLPGEDSRSSKAKALNSLLDPDYIRSTKEIDKALALKRIIATDAVVAKRQPGEINTALSEISDLAPTASSYPVLLRSMLRKRLELGQQMSDLDLNQMISMEKGVRENETVNVVPKVVGESGGDKDSR